VRHAGKAIRIVANNGIGDLINRIRSRANANNADRERQRTESEGRSRLVVFSKAIRTNAAVLVEALIPYAEDLTILDVIHGDHERQRLIHRHILKKFNLLDEDFYKRTYLADVDTIQPADHYMRFGLHHGLKPNAFFDPLEYLSAYSDISELGMDPVVHYALFGWRESRTAGSLFDGQWYLDSYADVAESGASPLIHFLGTGRFERRAPRPNAKTFGQGTGTIIVVSHDAELGGAQQVTRVLANWIQSATQYEVKLVTMRGGAFASSFSDIAPTFEMTAHPPAEVAERLKIFAGPDVKAVFINSVASGSFLKHWDADTPVLAFIHELPKMLRHFSANLDLIRDRAKTIIAGSEAVRNALRDEFDIDANRMERVYGFIEDMDSTSLSASENKRAAKEAIGIDPDALLITACGVLHWRKSPGKFIETAIEVTAKLNSAQFVWIGGGPDQDQCERMVADHGLDANVRFTGYEPDIMRWLAASDIFILPSEEDPFPLVCLYAAMALNPIICFRDAGGMPEFVAQGSGQAVPFNNTKAMAEAVFAYAQDPMKRERAGRLAREQVQSSYTIAATGPQLLHHIRKAAGLKPFVSVVVPNYNYARFLPERLRSIANQTFQDFEVILLDDHSTDGSIAVIEEWARGRVGTRVLVNDKNTGSPFAQWMRGMEAAQSDLIWVAEADDACLPNFLATLLPYFEDRNVFLGYTKSVPVTENGDVAGDYEAMYLDRISKRRWSQPYVVTDHEEANEGLGIANCIPNASSVIFRRFEPEPEFKDAITGMRMCGDWLFYLRAMRGGLVAYDNAPLNLHRRHQATITSSMEGSPRYFNEFETVRRYVGDTYRLGNRALEKIEKFTCGDLDRFGVVDADERGRILAIALNTRNKVIPSVLFVASDLSPGGGQLFVVRLANAWMRRGGRALIMNAQHFCSHTKVVSKIDPRVALFQADDPNNELVNIAARFDVDLVHSAIWWADRWVDDQITGMDDLIWVSTMHGCHETVLDNPLIDITFKQRMQDMLKRVDAYVPTADKNRRVFEVYGSPRAEIKIANGVDIESGKPKLREELGLRSQATVLCLASRAIAEKGWLDAIEMTEKLNAVGHKVDLMLIGEGPIADEIAGRALAHVHRFGQVENLQDYIAAADIGLLPSTFAGESMPLVLLEFMAMGKPVVATDVGEIRSMLGESNESGGITVPLVQGRLDIRGFVEAITSLLNEDTRRKVGGRAKQRFMKLYTTQQMLENYERLYRDLLVQRTTKK
jgi:glycosyltransferase involved in cell wall biosynthesis